MAGFVTALDIGKGKARTRYEFGVKASIATTNERCKGGKFVLGAKAPPGNPTTVTRWPRAPGERISASRSQKNAAKLGRRSRLCRSSRPVPTAPQPTDAEKD